jgi:hypothetical protein
MKTIKKADERKEYDLPQENNEPGEVGYNYGDDAIEIEKGEGEKIVYGSTFSPKDGDLGDESEDRGDLPSAIADNQYDPTLSTGHFKKAGEEETEELKRGIRVIGPEDAGLAFGPDNYTDDNK